MTMLRNALIIPPPVVGTDLEGASRRDAVDGTEPCRRSVPATLKVQVEIGRREALARGARLQGHFTTSRPSGWLEGRAALGITLDSVEYQGQTVSLVTSGHQDERGKKRNIQVIGGGASLCALIGALATPLLLLRLNRCTA
jgi:hypothetical protein